MFPDSRGQTVAPSSLEPRRGDLRSRKVRASGPTDRSHRLAANLLGLPTVRRRSCMWSVTSVIWLRQRNAWTCGSAESRVQARRAIDQEHQHRSKGSGRGGRRPGRGSRRRRIATNLQESLPPRRDPRSTWRSISTTVDISITDWKVDRFGGNPPSRISDRCPAVCRSSASPLYAAMPIPPAAGWCPCRT